MLITAIRCMFITHLSLSISLSLTPITHDLLAVVLARLAMRFFFLSLSAEHCFVIALPFRFFALPPDSLDPCKHYNEAFSIKCVKIAFRRYLCVHYKHFVIYFLFWFRAVIWLSKICFCLNLCLNQFFLSCSLRFFPFKALIIFAQLETCKFVTRVVILLSRLENSSANEKKT